MQRRISASDINLRNLFASGLTYSIPPHQRSYSWSEEQAQELFDDLWEAALEIGDDGSPLPYFMGLLVVLPGADETTWDVVDGQQRLTTLTMLLAGIRDLETDEAAKDSVQSLIADKSRPLLGERARYRLEPRSPIRQFLLEYVQTPGKFLALTEPARNEPPTTQRIRSAGKALMQRLLQISPSDRQKLAAYLIQNCVFVLAKVQDRDQAFGVFRTLNNRGVSLSDADVLKSEAFERAKLSPIELEKAAQQWEDWEEQIGRSRLVDVISHVGRIYAAQDSPHLSIIAAFRRHVFAGESPREFLQVRLPGFVRAFDELTEARLSGIAFPSEVNRRLRYLTWLPHKHWLAPAMKCVVSRRGDADALLRFFDRLERLGFALALLQSRSEVRLERYMRVMREMSDDRTLFAKGGALDLTEEEKRSVLIRLTRPFQEKDLRRAIVFRINAAMPNGEAPEPDDRATVEHVLPQNPDHDWSLDFPNTPERRELINSIGNFVILPKPANDLSGRMSFLEKKVVYREGNVNGLARFALTREVESRNEWTPATIRERQDAFVQVMSQAWQLAVR